MQDAEYKQSVTCTENVTLSSNVINYELDVVLTTIFGGITRNDDIRMQIRAVHRA